MTRTLARVLLCVALVISTVQAQRKTLQVLFIGDSYIFVNSLPEVVSGIAAGLRDGPAIASTMAATGGRPLGYHLANGPAMSLVADKPWDWVVLQEHSLLGGFMIDGEPRMAPVSLFHQSARDLVTHVREHKAMPLLMMTWARREYPAQEPILTNAYLDIGKELDVEVAAVGTAWEEVRAKARAIDLFAKDGGHPSPAGTYLAACVIYSSITGKSAKGAPAVIDGAPWSRELQDVDRSQKVRLVELTRDEAAVLQDIAWRTVSAQPQPTAAR